MMILRKSWELVLDIFFPPICLNCKNYLEDEEKDNLVCASCLSGIEIYSNLFYPASGITLAAASSYSDPTVRELIHYLKYKGFLKAAKPLGAILIKYLSRLSLSPQDFIIIPIPLHKSRYRKRGFNQAELLTETIGNYFNCPIETGVLKRVKETKPQIELPDYEARSKNLKNGFAIDEKYIPAIKDKKVLLVDDVYTSGATMKEAAKTLKRAGTKEVIGLVAAKADR